MLGIVDGLDEAELRRPVLPSGWSCVGLAPTEAWVVDPATPASDVLELYRREIELADAVIDGADLETPPAWWPQELFGDWRLDNVGDALLHVITETASHAGHLDAARELIDGRQWMVLE